MVKSVLINIFENSKVRFFNDPVKLNRGYITSFGVNLLLFLLLLSFANGDNTTLSFMSIFPVVTYINPLEQKGDIFKDNNKKSGIYRWTNKLSHKTYVGSAIDLTRRFRSYFSLAFLEKELRYGNSVICSSLLKYGYSEFSLEILEYCEKEELIVREQYYLDNLKPEYNILTIARSSKGFKHSQMTKTLLSRLGLNRIVSDDTKLKISINNSKSKSVVVTDIESGSKTEFSSIVKASKYMGISPNHFTYYLLKQPIKGRYLVVNIDGVDIITDDQNNKPSINTKSLPVCAIKMDTGVSYEFRSITKAAEFLEVTISFLSRCIREGKSCKGYNVTRKN